MDASLRKLCIAVLAAERSHILKLLKLVGSPINPEGLYLDMSEYVLDALGVPKDNTVAQSDKYGPDFWDQPDTFCRDWLNDKWYDIAGGPLDDDEAAVKYIDWVLSETEGMRNAN